MGKGLQAAPAAKVRRGHPRLDRHVREARNALAKHVITLVSKRSGRTLGDLEAQFAIGRQMRSKAIGCGNTRTGEALVDYQSGRRPPRTAILARIIRISIKQGWLRYDDLDSIQVANSVPTYDRDDPGMSKVVERLAMREMKVACVQAKGVALELQEMLCSRRASDSELAIALDELRHFHDQFETWGLDIEELLAEDGVDQLLFERVHLLEISGHAPRLPKGQK